MKFCPLLAMANLNPADNPYQAYACIEEKCAFWHHSNFGSLCCLTLLAEVAFKIAAARFPASVLSQEG